jgi:hypothetical protein
LTSNQFFVALKVFDTGLTLKGLLSSLLSGFCHFHEEKGHKRLEKHDLKPNFASKTSSYTCPSDRKINSSEKAMAFTVFYEEGQ